MKFSIQFTVLILIGLASSIQAKSPATTAVLSTDADFWLDQAAIELERAMGGPGEINLVHDLSMGIMLVRARENDADRALLQKLLDGPLPPKGPKTPQSNYAFSVKIAKIDALTALGRKDDARAQITEAEQLPVEKNLFGLKELSLALAYARLGEFDQAIAHMNPSSPLGPSWNLCQLAQAAAEADMPELRDRFIKEAVQGLIQDTDDSTREFMNVAKTQALFGDFDAATQTIRTLKSPYRRQQYLGELAQIAFAKGDIEQSRSLLDESITLVEVVNGYSHREIYTGLRRMAYQMREEACFIKAAELAAQDVMEEGVYSAFWSSEAFGAAIFKKQKMFDRALERAVAELQKEEDVEQRAESELYIAAAYACAGDRQAAMKWVEQSKQTFHQQDYGVSDAFHRFCEGTILSGNPELAIQDAIAAFNDPKDVGWNLRSAAMYECLRGNFKTAWQFAEEIQDFQIRRLETLRYIAQRQARSGNIEPLLVQVNSLDNPHERAAILLGIAQDILNLDGIGQLGIFQPRL